MLDRSSKVAELVGLNEGVEIFRFNPLYIKIMSETIPGDQPTTHTK